jgi:hypothetical protein
MGRVLDMMVTRAAREIRTQTGVVRALLEEVDAIDRALETETALDAQLVEELARLGCRILEAASTLAPPEETGAVSQSRLRDSDGT